ncbi:class I SAM-dependent methyltransferase [Sansalvadorimonas verongulae]|uniref:thiopurine S-methyltransferase n=1 Tax=Sansalvadorimonas verongulae TaxID=2172824 RepID=UPI0012BD1936|nr:thiopurine S-methyltransferase [Sansalvadorimonas verongulae]MTI14440.1 thiopurine S-methyltransferase [Sansalvadorimonas verongulae]
MIQVFQPTEPVVANEDWDNCWDQGFTPWQRPSWNPYLLRFFPLFDVAAETSVLVPLCGKSRDMEWLIRRGYRVVGLELSGLAIEEFFRERGLEYKKTNQYGYNLWRGPNIDIWEADMFALPDELTEATVLYDRGSLVALPPKLRESYVVKLKTIAPDLRCGLILGLEYDQSAIQGPPWSVSENVVSSLWGEGFNVKTLHTQDKPEEATRLKATGVDYSHITLRLDRV